MNTNTTMESFPEALLEQLHAIATNTVEEKQCIEESLSTSLDMLRQLRQWVELNGFPHEQAEICFFKHIKPFVKARCIYYGRLHQLYNSYQHTCTLWRQEQLISLQEKIGHYFSENRVLYDYYQLKHTSLDKVYFLRSAVDWKACPWDYDCDPVFSTGADARIAELMAFELLLKYIENDRRPVAASTAPDEQQEVLPALKCSASPINIVELGYALHAANFFNHGNTSIKEVMQFLEKVLQVNLSHYYHTFHRIKDRKNNTTRFLDELKQSFLRYMNEEYSDVSKK